MQYVKRSHHLLRGMDVVRNEGDVDSALLNEPYKFEQCASVFTYLCIDRSALAICNKRFTQRMNAGPVLHSTHCPQTKKTVVFQFLPFSVVIVLGMTFPGHLYKHHGCRIIVPIQLHAMYEYCSTCAQAWNITRSRPNNVAWTQQQNLRQQV